jgi:hypothetical protein
MRHRLLGPRPGPLGTCLINFEIAREHSNSMDCTLKRDAFRLRPCLIAAESTLEQSEYYYVQHIPSVCISMYVHPRAVGMYLGIGRDGRYIQGTWGRRHLGSLLWGLPLPGPAWPERATEW